MRRTLVLALLLAALVLAPVQAIVVARVTVATTATLVYTASTSGNTVIIRNPGAASVYLGGANTVTTANGFELAAGDAITLALGPSDTVYGIVASGTVVVHTLEPRR